MGADDGLQAEDAGGRGRGVNVLGGAGEGSRPQVGCRAKLQMGAGVARPTCWRAWAHDDDRTPPSPIFKSSKEMKDS